jgi:hypothetical protein
MKQELWKIEILSTVTVTTIPCIYLKLGVLVGTPSSKTAAIVQFHYVIEIVFLSGDYLFYLAYY